MKTNRKPAPQPKPERLTKTSRFRDIVTAIKRRPRFYLLKLARRRTWKKFAQMNNRFNDNLKLSDRICERIEKGKTLLSDQKKLESLINYWNRQITAHDAHLQTLVDLLTETRIQQAGINTQLLRNYRSELWATLHNSGQSYSDPMRKARARLKAALELVK